MMIENNNKISAKEKAGQLGIGVSNNQGKNQGKR